jgi:hypothetical protein
MIIARRFLIRATSLGCRGVVGVAMLAALPALAALGCSADRVVSLGTGVDSHRVTAGVGDRVDVRLWGGALGTYVSPPAISGPTVTFLDVSVDGPPNPGGPTQRFRFLAVSRGLAVVTFTPLESAPVVVDTIVVE